MSRKFDSETSSGGSRRQPLLAATLMSSRHAADGKDGSGGSRRGSRVGETAGECAAVCCCCPCTMVHLFLLAVYRLPRDLWRKKKRRSLLKKKRKFNSKEKENGRISRGGGDAAEEEEVTTDDEEYRRQNDAVDWDNDMWDRFYGAGFWRSGSRRMDGE